MQRDVTTMSASDIEWLQEQLDECERIGQGISMKEGAGMRRLRARLEARGVAA